MKSAIQVWRGFWRLKRYEKVIVAEAGAVLAITWLGLRFLGFSLWKNWIVDPPLGNKEFQVTCHRKSCKLDARRVARLQASARRHFPVRTNCLENSLALYWLLRRHGIPAMLRIGARKASKNFEAHAWVESEGIALDNSSCERVDFVPFVAKTAMESQTP